VVFFFFFFQFSLHHPDLHSFPTRRSSDLMKDGVNATPLPTVNTTGYIDHAAFLGTINPDNNKIPKHLFQGYLNIYNNYFKAPWRSEERFSRNAETDLVCRLLLEKKNDIDA